MARKLPKHVYSERTRHGRRVYYFRAGRGAARIRLPDEINSADFQEALRAARASNISVPLPRVERPSFDRTRRQRVGLTLDRIMRGARMRAAEKGMPFDLDLDWVMQTVEAQSFKCSLTGIPFYMDSEAGSKVHPFTPSLDRIIPSRGYARDNVRIVVYAMNVMLHDWGVEVFERVASGYRYMKGTKSRTLFPHALQEVRESEGIQQ